MKRQDRRVVIVTGGTRGIGAAIAEQFRQQGARVIITGTKSRPPTRNALDYVQVDFAEPASLKTFLAFIESLKRLDVCVNNAGINIIKEADQVTMADFDRVAGIDYRAPFFVSQAAARVMRKRRCGWILNVGSIWSVISKKGRTSYCAAKAGLAGMTRGLATDYAGDGILVNCLSPGFVMTDLTRQSLSASQTLALSRQVPLGRFADPAEIARVAAFLCSEGNTYLTGQNIVVDGGFTHV